MKRKEEKYLDNWLKGDRRKPLIIRGARQTGKSTLVRLFARNSGLKLIELNFEEDYRYKEIFSSNDVYKIIQSIEIHLNISIDCSSSILFLDEIQAHPEAIGTLRYFHEKLPELAVLAAGSLLEFVMEDHSFSMPVGRIEYLFIGPMTFEEYLHANEGDQLVRFFDNYTLRETVPDSIHNKALEHLKTYFLIGGMPEVVKTYIESGSLFEADKIKYSILNTFRDDFNKYKNRQELSNLQEVFDRLGVVVGKKIIYKSLLPDEKSYKVEKILKLFENAKLFYRAFHSSANNLPLKAEINKKKAKGIFLDIGLYLSVNGLSLASLNTEENLLFSNRGKLAEQFIGQHLLYCHPQYMMPEIYYWNREKSQSNAEIDYLLQLNNKILPIEVKSGKTGTLKSLHLFMEQKSFERAVRFSTNKPIAETIKSSLPGSDYSYDLVTLPLYLVEHTERLLSLF
jgi:uncharacterized protein